MDDEAASERDEATMAEVVIVAAKGERKGFAWGEIAERLLLVDEEEEVLEEDVGRLCRETVKSSQSSAWEGECRCR